MFLSCGTSTEDLAKQVQAGILKKVKEDTNLDVELVEELVLVKKNKTEYIGLMEIKRGSQAIKLSVEVLFDGKNIQYEWKQY